MPKFLETALGTPASYANAPAVLRYLGLPATPVNTGKLAVSSYDGTVNCTTGLQAFFDTCIANGDEMFLPAIGLRMRLTATVNISGLSSTFAGLRGVGRRCPMAFDAGNFHKFTMNLGHTGDWYPRAPIENIWIDSAGAPPSDGKALFYLDQSPQCVFKNIGGTGGDVLFAPRNNCWNLTIDGLTSPRFDANNHGLYLGPGAHSGSDLAFRNLFLFCKKSCVTINGNGGHYLLDFGQWGAQSTWVAIDDDWAPLTVCKGLMGDADAGNANTIKMHSIQMEGVKGKHGIRTHDQCQVSFDGCSFVPSSAAVGSGAGDQRMISIIKMTNAKTSRITFKDCDLAQGYIKDAFLYSASGVLNGFQFHENGWKGANGTNVAGVGQNWEGWLPSLQIQSSPGAIWTGPTTNLTSVVDGDGNPYLALGSARIIYTGGLLKKSNNGGTTQTNIET